MLYNKLKRDFQSDVETPGLLAIQNSTTEL